MLKLDFNFIISSNLEYLMWQTLPLHNVHSRVVHSADRLYWQCNEGRLLRGSEIRTQSCFARARETRFRRICPKTAQYEGVFLQRGRALSPRSPTGLPEVHFIDCSLLLRCSNFVSVVRSLRFYGRLLAGRGELGSESMRWRWRRQRRIQTLLAIFH